MLKYLHSVLDDQSASGGDTMWFDDESEVFEFAGKLKKEVEQSRRGKLSIEPGHCVEVELNGNEIHATTVQNTSPSFVQWRCESCQGLNDKCPWCKGKGWDVNGEKNAHGLYLREHVFVSGESMFILVRDEVWEEIDVGENDARA